MCVGVSACAFTQGVFNAVSGGILLYIALVQLIPTDFLREIPHAPDTARDSEPDAPAKDVAQTSSGGRSANEGDKPCQAQPGWLLPSCYAALFLGASLMAVLAIWA